MSDYRYTNLMTFHDCPYKYYMDVESTAKVIMPSPERDLGSAVHEAIRRILADGENMIDAALIYAINKCKKEKGHEGFASEFFSKDLAKLMIKRAIEYTKTMSDDLLVEEYIEFQNINENDPFSPVFHSQIDIYDKANETIIDWKSGRLKGKDLQIKVYAYMLNRKYGYMPKKGKFLYLRSNTEDEFEITPEDIQEADNWIKNTITTIENKLENVLLGSPWEKEFPPTPNQRCKTCSYSLNCAKAMSIEENLKLNEYLKKEDEIPTVLERAGEEGKPEQGMDMSTADLHTDPGEGIAGNTAKDENPDLLAQQSLDIEALKSEIKNNPELAEKVASEILRIETMLKTMKDILKEYVKVQGPVSVGTKVFDFYESVSWKISTENKKILATEIATMFGLNPWEYLDFTSTGRNKLKKDRNLTDNEIKEFLKKYGTESIRKNFDYREKQKN